MHDDAPDVWLSLNLTIAQLKSLMFISHKGVTNFKTLADALGVSPPNVTGIVERMVEQGLISREENPQNRRMLMLKVTDKGVAVVKKIHESKSSRFSGLLAKLSQEDLEALARGMAALAAVLQRNSPA
jgi:DNA-binding MarR family transcriptional regulator